VKGNNDESEDGMSADSTTNSYYTFVSPNGDTAAWTAGHASYRAPQNGKAHSKTTPQSEPIYVEAHIIDETDTPSGHKTTWGNTGNNPSAGFRTSWTSSTAAENGSRSKTGNGARANTGGNLVAGAVQTVAGVGLMAIGVPMLIFPGPGVAAIAGGAALAGSGIRKLVQRR